MNRTKLILITCMLGNVAAHSEVLLEPQTKTLSQSHGFTVAESTTSNSYLLIHDAFSAPTLSRDLIVDQTGLAATGKNLTPNLAATSVITEATSNSDRNNSSHMWLMVLAATGMVAWQLRRKQKSLRFDQSCLAKGADYAVR